MVGLIGKKIGSTRVYDDAGNVVCVTVVHTGDNRVLQCKSAEDKMHPSGPNPLELLFCFHPKY